MTNERQINGGNELMNFFCKHGFGDGKGYCEFIVEDDRIYCGAFTSYNDGEILYHDLLNPNIKWNVTFDKFNKLLRFENGNNYVYFVMVYYDVKDFFEVNK